MPTATLTHGHASAIARIGEVIGEISDLANSIAAAVERQSVTTSGITRNVTDTANGATEIAWKISGVAGTARDTTRGAKDTQTAARALSEVAMELRTLVGRFRL